MASEIDIDDLIKKYGYINFEPVTERWSEYILSDKTILKIKTVPLKFLDVTDYPMNSIVISSTFSPPELRGTPSTTRLLTDIQRDQLQEMDMRFDILDEPWNEYQLDNGIKVFIRTVLTSVSSSNVFDDGGEPRYLLIHQTLTKRYPLF